MDDGQLEIKLNGKEVALRCSLRAYKTVNRAGPGFTAVFQRLAAFEAETYILVVAAGLNEKPTDVEQAVYENGITELTSDLTDYVTMLMNGGRAERTEKPKGEA